MLESCQLARPRLVSRAGRRWANTCRVLMVMLNDGSEHLAYFNFTK